MNRPLTMTALGLLLALGVASCAQPGEMAGTTAGTQVSVAEPMAQVASRVDNFRLVTADGHARELYRYKDAPAIVLVMHASGSADSAKAAAELAKLQTQFAPKGVEFMLVNSTTDTRDAMLADAAKNGITAPILQDDLQLVGGQIGASRVGQAFVIDPKSWKIAYSGPVSADAVAAVVEGKAVAPAPAQAAGTLGYANTAVGDALVLDPALPLGLVGPSLRLPYDVVLHGAEVTVPGRVPGTRRMLARVLRDARLVVAAGGVAKHVDEKEV